MGGLLLGLLDALVLAILDRRIHRGADVQRLGPEPLAELGSRQEPAARQLAVMRCLGPSGGAGRSDGDTTLDVHQDAVGAGEAEVRAAPGAVRVVGSSVRLIVDKVMDGPGGRSFPKQ